MERSGRLDEIARRFAALYTGAVTDVLDDLGYANQTLPPEIRPLREGMRLAGPAFTVEGRPHAGHDYDVSIRKILAMLGAVPAHHVVVYQTNDRLSAHLGELSVSALKARACAGAVIDGGCRDVEYILREEFAVFTRYTTPQDCVPRWELAALDVPIVVGGVHVRPRDYVFADHDGAVVIPEEVRDVVLERAEERVGTENEVRKAVRAGVAPLEAYTRFGTF